MAMHAGEVANLADINLHRAAVPLEPDFGVEIRGSPSCSCRGYQKRGRPRRTRARSGRCCGRWTRRSVARPLRQRSTRLGLSSSPPACAPARHSARQAAGSRFVAGDHPDPGTASSDVSRHSGVAEGLPRSESARQAARPIRRSIGGLIEGSGRPASGSPAPVGASEALARYGGAAAGSTGAGVDSAVAFGGGSPRPRRRSLHLRRLPRRWSRRFEPEGRRCAAAPDGSADGRVQRARLGGRRAGRGASTASATSSRTSIETGVRRWSCGGAGAGSDVGGGPAAWRGITAPQGRQVHRVPSGSSVIVSEAAVLTSGRGVVEGAVAGHRAHEDPSRQSRSTVWKASRKVSPARSAK